MLNVDMIDDFLTRIGTDMTYSVTDRDEFGDIISVFNPDVKYEDIKNKVNNSRPMRNRIIDSGLKYMEIHDDIYVNGDKVKIAILCEEGENGFGTRIKMMVKNISSVVNGEMKNFLSFESMKNYKERFMK